MMQGMISNMSDDDSSDIRTIRTNGTQFFSHTSGKSRDRNGASTGVVTTTGSNDDTDTSDIVTYYTNPTLAPPRTKLNRNVSAGSSSSTTIDYNYDDQQDQTTLSSHMIDYNSPTSIVMTNYDSYSKFGAAPIYSTGTTRSSNNAIHPNPHVNSNIKGSKAMGKNNLTLPLATSNVVQLQQHANQRRLSQVSCATGTTSDLITIHENEDVTPGTDIVYYPPSYYKKNQKQQRNGIGPGVGPNFRGDSKASASTRATTPRPAPVITSIDRSTNSNNITKVAPTLPTSSSKSVCDETAITDKTTSTSSRTGASWSASKSTDPTDATKDTQVTDSSIAVSPPTKEMEQKSSIDVTKPTSPPPPATTTSSSGAFSIFKRMTSSHSPVRNRSRSASPIPPRLESTIPKGDTSKNDKSLLHSTSRAVTTLPTSTAAASNSSSRSLRNYMNTIAYKTRRGSGGGSNSSSPITTPVTTNTATSTNSITPSLSGSVNGGRMTPPITTTSMSALEHQQDMIVTPIKHNRSNNSDQTSNVGPTTYSSSLHLPSVKTFDPKQQHKKPYSTSVADVTNAAVTVSPPSATTKSTTTSSSSSSGYSNPNLKSVSSKLFVSPPPPSNVVVGDSNNGLQKIQQNSPDGIPNTAIDLPVPRLNLDIIDQLNNSTDDDCPDNKDKQQTFRLWTDDDSAFGKTWYSFRDESPFESNDYRNQNNTSIVSMESLTEENVVVPDEKTAYNLPLAATETSIQEELSPPTRGKLSLSLLQLKQMNRASSAGSTITTDDDGDTAHRYPSMVSSEYDDEDGGGESTIGGNTLTYPNDDGSTTLGGGPSFDFSVSACLDDESLKKDVAPGQSTTASPSIRSNPIMYSNVGQALNRDNLLSNSNSLHTSPTLGPRLISPLAEKFQRRRSYSSGKNTLSPPLEIIEEYKESNDSQKSSSAEPSVNNTAYDSMVVVSLADSITSTNPKNGLSESKKSDRGVEVKVIRKLDCIQICIILFISIALAGVICATFCILGSCQVGNSRRLEARIQRGGLSQPPTPKNNFLRPIHKTDTTSYSTMIAP